MPDYNLLAGLSFAIWGLIHVFVGAVALVTFFTRGTESMLDVIDIYAAVNEHADRMSDFATEFYYALLLIGLTTTILGVTLNLEGNPIAYWINVVLVANIEAALVWFAVTRRALPAGLGRRASAQDAPASTRPRRRGGPAAGPTGKTG